MAEIKMAITIAAATVLVVTMLAFNDQQAPQASGAISEVAQLERDWAAAVSQGDAEALVKMLADDGRFIEPEGTLSGAEAAAGLRKRFASPPPFKEVIDRVEVQVYGNTAVATGEYSLVRMKAGKEERGSPTTFDDVAVKRNG